jgi:polysaccharide biosynthesis protein PelE
MTNPAAEASVSNRRDSAAPTKTANPGIALVVVALALTIAEGILSAAVARGMPLLVILVGHMVVLAVSGAWLFRPACRQMRYGALLWISTAAFGPLGGVGVLLAMILERRHARHATSAEEWHATLFPPTEHDDQDELWRRIGQRARDRPGERDVTPFLDILTFGSVPQRQVTISIIVQQFDPAFAPALRAALGDEHNVIRVQAATAIARLEHQFFERTLLLEAALDQAPDDADAILALASHHDEQAFAGLFDPAREQHCRVKAEELYERYLVQRPGDSGIEFRMARLLLRRRNAPAAELRFRRLADAGHPTARLWLMECLFAQGRYDDVRRAATGWGDRADAGVMPEADEAVALWAGPGAAA